MLFDCDACNGDGDGDCELGNPGREEKERTRLFGRVPSDVRADTSSLAIASALRFLRVSVRRQRAGSSPFSSLVGHSKISALPAAIKRANVFRSMSSSMSSGAYENDVLPVLRLRGRAAAAPACCFAIVDGCLPDDAGWGERTTGDDCGRIFAPARIGVGVGVGATTCPRGDCTAAAVAAAVAAAAMTRTRPAARDNRLLH